MLSLHSSSRTSCQHTNVQVTPLWPIGTARILSKSGQAVGPAQGQEPVAEHLGIEGGTDVAPGFAPLDAPAHLHQPGGEPAHHVEAVNHVGGTADVGPDGGPVGLRAVGHHHLDSAAPPMALGRKEAAQCRCVAMADHAQDLGGLAVEQHGYVAVAPAQRGLVDQQHPTG